MSRRPPLVHAAVISLALLAGASASGPAVAKGREKDPAPAATSSVGSSAPASGVDDTARKAAFAEYEGQLATGQKARAADALVALVDDPARAAFHAEAYTRLGDLFGELSLPYAAAIAYAKGFDLADPTNVADIGQRVPKALEAAIKVGDRAVLQPAFAKNVGLARTEDVRGQMAYLAARENVRQKNYGVALGVIKMVPRGDPLYPEARALEGIVLSQQERWQDALTAFQDAQKAGGAKGKEFLDLQTLNLARAYYGAGNYPQAMRAFAAVSRESDQWPEAQFERSWAHFRVDDYNGTLSLLMSLDNPFFADFYYPEADLLRVYSAFMMCKFPASKALVEDFITHYKPIQATLKGWQGKTAADAFEAARRFREKGETGDLPRMILRPWATEERFGESIAAVDSANDELNRLKNVAANPFSDRARQWVTDRRNALIGAEGRRIQDRVAGQEAQLAEMLLNVQLFTVDIQAMTARLLQQAAEIGKMPDAARTVQREDPVRKGWQEWPYEGEVWADEIGYYRVTTVPECPASLRQSVQSMDQKK